MKAKTRLILASLFISSAALALADEEVVDYSQLPAATRQAFEVQAKGQRIEKIEARTFNNQAVYEFQLDRTDGGMRTLRITGDGQTIRADGRVAGQPMAEMNGNRPPPNVILNPTEPSPASTGMPTSGPSAEAAAPTDPAAATAPVTVIAPAPATTTPAMSAEPVTTSAPVSASSRTTTTVTPANPGEAYYNGYDGVSAMPTLRRDELPAAVQAAMDREANGRTVDKITSETVDGRRAYGVEFKEKGQNPWLYLAEDGTVLRPTEKSTLMGFGTSFSDTPASVQQALRREVGRGEILSIEKEHHDGEAMSYKVKVRDSANSTYELRLSADGQVLENTRPSSTLPSRG